MEKNRIYLRRKKCERDTLTMGLLFNSTCTNSPETCHETQMLKLNSFLLKLNSTHSRHSPQATQHGGRCRLHRITERRKGRFHANEPTGWDGIMPPPPADGSSGSEDAAKQSLQAFHGIPGHERGPKVKTSNPPAIRFGETGGASKTTWTLPESLPSKPPTRRRSWLLRSDSRTI